VLLALNAPDIEVFPVVNVSSAGCDEGVTQGGNGIVAWEPSKGEFVLYAGPLTQLCELELKMKK
jgi:hypothetical protein